MSDFRKVFRFFESFCDLILETLVTFLTIENNNMNNYIVTFEYRVMVTASAILAMFQKKVFFFLFFFLFVLVIVGSEKLKTRGKP